MSDAEPHVATDATVEKQPYEHGLAAIQACQRCGAKARSRGGAPCRQPVVPGSSRCHYHGGKSRGPREPGKRRLRRMRLKTGERSRVFGRVQELHEAVNASVYDTLSRPHTPAERQAIYHEIIGVSMICQMMTRELAEDIAIVRMERQSGCAGDEHARQEGSGQSIDSITPP